jgi:hypothetical protein
MMMAGLVSTMVDSKGCVITVSTGSSVVIVTVLVVERGAPTVCEVVAVAFAPDPVPFPGNELGKTENTGSTIVERNSLVVLYVDVMVMFPEKTDVETVTGMLMVLVTLEVTVNTAVIFAPLEEDVMVWVIGP